MKVCVSGKSESKRGTGQEIPLNQGLLVPFFFCFQKLSTFLETCVEGYMLYDNHLIYVIRVCVTPETPEKLLRFN